MRINRAAPPEADPRRRRTGRRVPLWLEDRFVDSYRSWRAACDDVRRAYSLLEDWERHDLPLAFAAYEAALDREESAAHAYQELVHRLLAWSR
jgi:hypothetical protein